jgi:co-chaperonin GroES (HSP10)
MRTIKPIGEQIIIRTFPPSKIGSIIIPDSAKGITQMGSKGTDDAIHFVEAEVIAVGTGLRAHDPGLVTDMARELRKWAHPMAPTKTVQSLDIVDAILSRAENGKRQPFMVKPGDRILYHPAVQKFDRQIPPEWIGLEPGEGECFIIREESVLAILDLVSATRPPSRQVSTIPQGDGY